MHICLEFLIYSTSESFFRNENLVLFLYNTNRLSANLHVTVRLDSIKDKTNQKKFILLIWDRVPVWAMCIYSSKKPKLTSDLRMSNYLCTTLQASINCRQSFIIKLQAVASSITKVGEGDQHWPRQAETYGHILPHWCGTTQPGIQGYFLINVNAELKRYFKRHLCCVFTFSYCFISIWKIYSEGSEDNKGLKESWGF